MNDPVRTYTPGEEEALARNLLGIAQEIQRGALGDRRATVDLLREFHGKLFAGIRSHAGRCRGPGVGSEHLVFGPNRSIHRNKVSGELDKVFESVRRSMASFEDNPEDPEYDSKALHLAVWAHAEVIHIHPFEDGNGRTGRALMDWILVRLGLRAVAIEVPKEEYRDCLNHYYRTQDLDPLVDLVLSTYFLPEFLVELGEI